jgi:DNA-binding response OmpR family regulator
MRVLVVEDQVALADYIGDGLRDHGFAADVAYDGSVGLEKALMNQYDVIVLDRDLPKVHGDALCATLVAGPTPARILMLTAAAEIDARVEGLNLGADDYLAKPFSFAELTARIRALGRRAAEPVPPVLQHGDIKLDPGSRTVSRVGRRLELSAKEFAVLEYLLARAGRIVSAEELLERVWDEAADPFTTAVKKTMHRLRAKLGDPPVIDTVRDGGYRIGAS